MKQLLVLTLAMLLTGCAGAGRQPISIRELPEHQGVMLVSGGASEFCWNYDLSAIIKPRGESRSIFEVSAGFQLNNPLHTSDFPDTHSQVFAFPVEGGEYDFWLHSAAQSDPEMWSTFVEIGAGEIVYVGEIWVRGCPFSKVEVRDQWERDRPVFATRFPELPLDRVESRIFALR